MEVLTLAPTEHLSRSALHGLRWRGLPPIHWAADAARILARAGDPLNRHTLGFPLYLRTIWGLDSLRNLPGTVVSKTVRRLWG